MREAHALQYEVFAFIDTLMRRKKEVKKIYL